MVHTLAFRDGRIVQKDFSLDDVSELCAGRGDPESGARTLLWIDVDPDDAESLAQLGNELGLHPLALEDAAEHHQRVKLDRYPDHLFLAVYALSGSPKNPSPKKPSQKNHGLDRHELTMFVLPDVLVTVRNEDDFDMSQVCETWEGHPDVVAHGVGGLLWGVLDVIVDSHLAAAQQLDERLERIEEMVFSGQHDQQRAQRATYHVHKDVGMLRRFALPMRDILDSLTRPDDNTARFEAPELQPYFRDVNDHVQRVMGWTDALRDVATTLLDANLTVQSNQMNLVMKKVTSWAAIIAVPTLITGIYGMNVTYPLFGTVLGWWIAAVFVAVPPVVLYAQFKAHDWL